VRAVTWNVWWRFGDEWRERQDRILATLRGLRPDVVGLQESWIADGTSQAAELGRELGMSAAVAAPSLPPAPVPPEAPDQAGIELGVALLSRWPVLDVARVPLPAAHRPYAPLSLVATLDHPDGPLHTVVSCIEFEPEYRGDQLAQSDALAALLADPARDGPHPVLLLADLNAEPGSAEIERLSAVAVDAWTAGGGDPDAVTLSRRTPWAPVAAERLIDQRIDWVFARPGGTRPVTVERAFLAGDEPVDGLFPSDHFAVVVDLAPG
jgi:endonuclease/exonuclease/phosphatase family metal-dependent hydrolase